MSDAFLSISKSYDTGGLERSDLADNPFDQLRIWLDDAANAGVEEPNGMALSTVGEGGNPSSRVVLLRTIDHGLVFFTNHNSRKGKEVLGNPNACVLFWWGLLNRQVRVEGAVETISSAESDAYFASRPRDSQLASAASPQSAEISSRNEVESRMAALAEEFPRDVPRPEHWGGYRLVPDRFEFWQGRLARLHDRFTYTRQSDGWRIARLAP